MDAHRLEKAAERGEPSYVWRAGQERRLDLVRAQVGDRINGMVLEDGCGLGTYLKRFDKTAHHAFGLEIEFDRCLDAHAEVPRVVCAAGESVPLTANTFDLVFSNEVLEHVKDDRRCVEEIVRVLKPGGRFAFYVPNRGYPFETHGIYRNGKYSFGNKLFINYLPRRLRDKLAPHVNIYTRADLEKLFTGLSVKFIHRTVVFGAYDNIITRFPLLGKALRAVLQSLEKTPLRVLGLSHFWVVEKTA